MAAVSDALVVEVEVRTGAGDMGGVVVVVAVLMVEVVVVVVAAAMKI